MSSVEPGYCSMQEYKKGQANRLMPDELILNELHVLMVAVEKIPNYRAHGKRPRNCAAVLACRELCEVYEIEKEASGLYRVGFHVVDEDRVMLWERCGGKFDNGYWVGIEPGEDLGIDGEIVVSGYIQGMPDDPSNDIMAFFASRQTPVAVG
ncbi:MAG TPA: hypothetical protein VM124_03325 [Candidatus Limnocylindrales bacterium]|nr:hypothetical protein [Candidatus Limnocylindrales bacterium]